MKHYFRSSSPYPSEVLKFKTCHYCK